MQSALPLCKDENEMHICAQGRRGDKRCIYLSEESIN